MVADSPIPKEIADEAARWFADRDTGLLDDESLLHAWLDADPRHAQAFAEMEVIWSDLGDVTLSPAIPTPLATPPIALPMARGGALRRWAPMSLAASLAFAIVGQVNDWPTRSQAEAMTV